VHVDVVEDEAAPVEVEDQPRGSSGPVQAYGHPVRIEVLHPVDVFTRLLGGHGAGFVTGPLDVVAGGVHGLLVGLPLDGGPGLGVERHQRANRASSATATAAATRKSTRWSGTVTS
jgi:hypothetical protein